MQQPAFLPGWHQIHSTQPIGGGSQTPVFGEGVKGVHSYRGSKDRRPSLLRGVA